MAVVSGLTGAWSNALNADWALDIQSWSADLTIQTVDVSSFDARATSNNVGWREKAPVVMGLSGSAEGVAEDLTAEPLAFGGLLDGGPFDVASVYSSGSDITLTAESGNTWAFNGIMTGVSMTASATDVVRGTYSFISNGNITQTWA